MVPARGPEAEADPDWDLLLEVAVKPGVADPVAGTLRDALRTVLELAVPESALVQTARQYRFSVRYRDARPLGSRRAVQSPDSERTGAQRR